MINLNYANAYKEVLTILDKLTKEDYNKIPKEYIEFFTLNCNKEYEFYYDDTKTLNEQELLEDTRYILFGLFEKFGATELQKEKIKSFRNHYYNNLEEEKRKTYNTEDIFKKREDGYKNNNEEILESNTNTSLVEYKESFFTRFKNYLFKILHKNK